MAPTTDTLKPTNPSQISTIQNMIVILSDLHKELSKSQNPSESETNSGETGENRGQGSAAQTSPVNNAPQTVPINNDVGSVDQSKEVGDFSIWGICRRAKKKKIENLTQSPATTQGYVEERSREGKDDTSNDRQIAKLLRNLKSLIDALTKTKNLEERLHKQINVLKNDLDGILTTGSSDGSFPIKSNELAKLLDITDDIRKLKHQIPSVQKPLSAATNAHRSKRRSNGADDGLIGDLPNLHLTKIFEQTTAFKEIKKLFEGFDNSHQNCLMCFAVFPENAVLKRRILTYWWVGENLLASLVAGVKTPEEVSREILKKFVEKGFIEPVKEKRRSDNKSYKMPPLVRSAVIMLAKEKKFFDYDDKGIPTANFVKCNRVCLVKKPPQQVSQGNPNSDPQTQKQGSQGNSNSGPEKQQQGSQGSSKSKQEKKQVSPGNRNSELENLETILNVTEPFPDLQLEELARAANPDLNNVDVVEWLRKMKNLKVLYLGRSHMSATHRIELENTEILGSLENMKKLRLLSLQGIFMIKELPDSIKSLTNLTILDLKACHNLEVIPKEIGKMKRLTHLDISDCYMLDRLPKELSELKELRVLKGFLVATDQIGRACTLMDLVGLKRMRKLSINSSREDFPNQKELLAMQDLGKNGALRKLTIAWGWGVKQPEAKGKISRSVSKQMEKKGRPIILRLPEQLEKLDLQCFPHENLPSWLVPATLINLKKLYIRGGRLNTLGDSKWETVEILSLKFLTEVKMEWRELRFQFPKMEYLERVKCPWITLCPCDENGVWKK